MKKVSSWLDDTPPVDVSTATERELLDAWAANRNSTLAVMASEELTRRRYKELEKQK